MKNLINDYKNIFFLGIKGVAMANLAVILKKIGKNVTGYDTDEEFITDRVLKEHNIKWSSNLILPKNTDLFIYSAAHGGRNHKLYQLAEERHIKILSQPELINLIMSPFSTKIAICGCHGKTTTTALTAYALKKIVGEVSYLVGAPFFNNFVGGDFSKKSKYFVVEADEYGVNPPFDKRIKFSFLSPDWIICTNIDYDHPDVYKNLKEVEEAFFSFFDHRQLILNIDNLSIKKFLPTQRAKKVITYGLSKTADYQIIDWSINKRGSFFKINKLGNFNISLYGVHNILNASAVIILLVNLGFSVEKIKKAITNFKGAKRRFELVYQKDFILFDDYAHHPKEIEAVLNTVKEIFPNQRIIVIFQPHTFSRTKSLLNDFIKALNIADKIYLLPIFPSARENPSDFDITSQDLVKLNPKKMDYFLKEEKLLMALAGEIKNNDIILTLGAGDVYKIGPKLIALNKNTNL
ncbi:MAG: UDP-N-acetylmuramate--L-alanine ligase [Microgenomates group bacterium]